MPHHGLINFACLLIANKPTAVSLDTVSHNKSPIRGDT